MLTWMTLWPFMAIPFVLPFLLGILPMFSIAGQELGGPLLRQSLVNGLAALLPYEPAVLLVAWFTHASLSQELILHALICLNLGLVVYPLFYAMGVFSIRTAAWRVRTEMAQRQSLLNRR